MRTINKDQVVLGKMFEYIFEDYKTKEGKNAFESIVLIPANAALAWLNPETLDSWSTTIPSTSFNETFKRASKDINFFPNKIALVVRLTYESATVIYRHDSNFYQATLPLRNCV